MVAESINFMDVVCLQKLTPDTVLEKFGSLINASFFDASNIAGTLKQKGLIDFSANYPGPNGIIITDAGKNLLDEMNTRSGDTLDHLDNEILAQMSNGKRLPFELAKTINLGEKDLALRLYKLYKQNFILYELKNGKVEVMLAEAGFLRAKTPEPQPQIRQPKEAKPMEVPTPGVNNNGGVKKPEETATKTAATMAQNPTQENAQKMIETNMETRRMLPHATNNNTQLIALIVIVAIALFIIYSMLSGGV